MQKKPFERVFQTPGASIWHRSVGAARPRRYAPHAKIRPSSPPTGLRAPIEVTEVTLEPEGKGFKISRSALTLRANVPNLDEAKFAELAKDAEKNCPVSKVLNAEITLDAKLAWRLAGTIHVAPSQLMKRRGRRWIAGAGRAIGGRYQITVREFVEVAHYQEGCAVLMTPAKAISPVGQNWAIDARNAVTIWRRNRCREASCQSLW